MDRIIGWLDKTDPVAFVMHEDHEAVFTCPECGLRVNFLELTDNGRFLCEECNLRKCPICGDWSHPDEFVSHEGYSYCGSYRCRRMIGKIVRIMEA